MQSKYLLESTRQDNVLVQWVVYHMWYLYYYIIMRIRDRHSTARTSHDILHCKHMKNSKKPHESNRKSSRGEGLALTSANSVQLIDPMPYYDNGRQPAGVMSFMWLVT